MATRSKFHKDLKKQNLASMKGFCDAVMSSVSDATKDSVLEAANNGVALMAEQATFSDYTGSLMGGYAALIRRHGSKSFGNAKRNSYGNISMNRTPAYQSVFKQVKSSQTGGFYTSKSRGQKNSADARSNFFGKDGELEIITNYNRTTKWGIVGRDKYGRIKIKNPRNPASKKWRSPWRGTTQGKFGWGHLATKVKTNNRIKLGYSVLFTNLAPYAQFVQERNKGSRVFPGGKQTIMLTQRMLRNYFKRLNGK